MTHAVEQIELPGKRVEADGVDESVEGRAATREELEDGDSLGAVDEGEDFRDVDEGERLHDVVGRVVHEDHGHDRDRRRVAAGLGVVGAEAGDCGEDGDHAEEGGEILNAAAQDVGQERTRSRSDKTPALDGN